VRNEHLGGPAIISQRFENRITSKRQRLFRASVYAEKIIVFAFKADTFVIFGT
jgi:hypothetical protein